MKKSKVVAGPQVVTKKQEIEEKETKEEEIQETQTEDTTEDAVTEEEEEVVTDPHAASGEIDKDDMGYTIYTPDNTKQSEIPFKYKVWSAVALIAMMLFGYLLANKHTYIPVQNVEVTVEVNQDDSSFIVLLDDLEHSQVDLFYDNNHLAINPAITSKGLLYSNLKPGVYVIHVLDVRRSYINYGVYSVDLGAPVEVANLTELVAKSIKALPDEGNKLSICNALIESFLNAAKPGCVDIAARQKELVYTNNVALGFNGEQKLQNEAVWYDIFKDKGVISNYLKEKGIVIDLTNYSAVYTAIANGIKEGSR